MHYINKGYNIDEHTKTVNVRCDDLSKGCRKKVNVKCDFCGRTLDVIWGDYYAYSKKNDKYSCDKCRQTKISQNDLPQRQESLYLRALDFCNKKGYKLITEKEDLKTSNTIVDYICPYHGLKHTKVYALVLKHGCDECKIKNQKLSVDTVREIFVKNKIQCLNVEQYCSTTLKNLKVVCPECCNIFITSYNSLVSVSQQRCPSCSKSESQGEFRVRKYLEYNNINFIQEYSFQNCNYKHKLFFDFYLPDKKIAIEYDGIQHYKPIRWGSITEDMAVENFAEYRKRDKIKDLFCKSNGITLIRISYKDFNNIEVILNNYIFNTHEDIV